MKQSMQATGIAMLLGALLAGGAGAEVTLLDGVAARVNRHFVTIGDALAAAQPAQQSLRGEYEGKALEEKLRGAYEEAVSTLVEQWLIVDAYEKLEQKLPEWVVDERVQTLIHDRFGGDRTKFLEALAKDGMDIQQWRSEVRDHVAAGYLKSGRIERNLRLSPNRVKKAYEQNPADFRKPEKVRLRMIVIAKGEGKGSDAALQKAEALAARLKAGADFAAAAKTESEGEKAAGGGDWGWVEPDMLRPELADAAKRLRPGEIGGPVAIGDEIYLLKLEGRQDAGMASLAEARAGIEERLRREEAKRLYTRWIGHLTTQSHVRRETRERFDL